MEPSAGLKASGSVDGAATRRCSSTMRSVGDDPGLDGLQAGTTSAIAVKLMQMNSFMFTCDRLGKVDRQVQDQVGALGRLADADLEL